MYLEPAPRSWRDRRSKLSLIDGYWVKLIGIILDGINHICGGYVTHVIGDNTMGKTSSMLAKARENRAAKNNGQPNTNTSNNSNATPLQNNAVNSNEKPQFYKNYNAIKPPFTVPEFPEAGTGGRYVEFCDECKMWGFKTKTGKFCIGYANVVNIVLVKEPVQDGKGGFVRDANGEFVYKTRRATENFDATIQLYADNPKHLEYMEERKNKVTQHDHIFEAEFTIWAFDDHHREDIVNNKSRVFRDPETGKLVDVMGNIVEFDYD